MQNEILNLWKLVLINPIFKVSRTLAANYRPISLTSIVCKLLESIIRDEFLNHLILNSLLNPAQHGFVPHRSCLSNLLETFDFITASLADSLNVDEVLLDFAKAFDLVSHRRLLHKLAGYGVSHDILFWFEDFLSNRKQRVVFSQKMFERSDVVSGVP